MADPGIVLGLHRSRHRRDTLTGALDLGVTHLDTGFSYRAFTSHETLADVAADLLGRFTVSTKIGFFRTPDGVRHSLAPELLGGGDGWGDRRVGGGRWAWGVRCRFPRRSRSPSSGWA